MTNKRSATHTISGACRRHKKAGFTLVEVLVSIMILAFCLSGTLFIFTKAHLLMNEIKQKAIALDAVKSEIETIRGMNFDSVLLLGSNFSENGFNQLKNPVGTLTLSDTFSSGDIRRVTASVSWESISGRTNSVSLSTNVTREGVNKQ